MGKFWTGLLQPQGDDLVAGVHEEAGGDKAHHRHIRHTIMEEIAKVMKTGLSSGDTMRNASFRDSFSTAKYSRMQQWAHNGNLVER